MSAFNESSLSRTSVQVETDVPVSEIPLPSSRMPTTLNESSISRTSLQVETHTTQFSIFGDALPIDHTFTEISTEILLPEVNPSPVENLSDTSEKFEINVPISEIPLPRDPRDPEILPSAAFLKDLVLNRPKRTFDSDSILKINSEFSKLCRIVGDYFQNTNACVSEKCPTTENLNLNVINNERERGIKTSLVLLKRSLVDLKSEMDKTTPTAQPIDSKVKANRIRPASKKKIVTPSQLRIAARKNKTDVSSNSAFKKNIDNPKIQIADHDKPSLRTTAGAELRLQADVSSKDAKSTVAFIKPNTRKGREWILFSESCDKLDGPPLFVEPGAARKTTSKKNVSPQNLPTAVHGAISKHRSAVQKFLARDQGSEGPKQRLSLSTDKAEIQEIGERRPNMAAAETGSIEAAPKSSETRQRRSKKKNVKKSPAEENERKDFEPDVTG